MKAHKVDDVSFRVNLIASDSQIDLSWKNGGLFLSIRGLLFEESGEWFEAPITDVRYIRVIKEEPLKLLFGLNNVDIVVTGDNPNHLMALRHFLLPFVSAA